MICDFTRSPALNSHSVQSFPPLWALHWLLSQRATPSPQSFVTSTSCSNKSRAHLRRYEEGTFVFSLLFLSSPSVSRVVHARNDAINKIELNSSPRPVILLWTAWRSCKHRSWRLFLAIYRPASSADQPSRSERGHLSQMLHSVTRTTENEGLGWLFVLEKSRQ